MKHTDRYIKNYKNFQQGGNDFEIYNHESVIGHSVQDPQDTIKQICEIFDIQKF